ncbi:hypothetical protein HUJ05_000232 [Dendroctonus ponderosae]|nr:hypothetical protein HUJ05_000232 [Dendroctonus ponderosae]
MGAVLEQHNNGCWEPLGFFSKKFSNAQSSYSTFKPLNLLILFSVNSAPYEDSHSSMPYPDSPFDATFNPDIITSLKQYSESCSEVNLSETLKWLCTTPKVTSYRVNTLKTDRKIVKELIQEQLNAEAGAYGFRAEYSDFLPNVIVINHIDVNHGKLHKLPSEVMVDVDCAAAVLRGAHIYAPGVLSMISGTLIGDKVSIYADLNRKCKKGLLKIFPDNGKVFLGNGVVKMTRSMLFGDNLAPEGVAVGVTETISGCPSIGDAFLPSGFAMLQNVPSIMCVNALDPQKNDLVLDMCASPGNKTTHIAALMENQGTLIAIDKTAGKVAQLRKTCQIFAAKLRIFQADSSKIVVEDPGQTAANVDQGPPFLPETFDKILLDAPCSVLGKRPQFHNRVTEKVLKSYVPLQRKLFTSAVSLLKPKGRLVYSTCTITLAENEGIVEWALRTFKCLCLVNIAQHFGSPGWPGTTLTEAQRAKVQRFGPNLDPDTVGFFIACFEKN